MTMCFGASTLLPAFACVRKDRCGVEGPAGPHVARSPGSRTHGFEARRKTRLRCARPAPVAKHLTLLSHSRPLQFARNSEPTQAAKAEEGKAPPEGTGPRPQGKTLGLRQNQVLRSPRVARPPFPLTRSASGPGRARQRSSAAPKRHSALVFPSHPAPGCWS